MSINQIISKVSIKVTVFFKSGLWRATFERRDDNKFYSVAQHVFGKEPTDPELYEFILKEYHLLKFTEPQDFVLEVKRQNPKRVLREIKWMLKEIKTANPPATYAEETLKKQQEANKLVKKIFTKQEKEETKERKFNLKQEKRKQKHKGH